MIFSELDIEHTSQPLVTAIVTDNVDPDGKNRLKVQYPWDSDADESYWARVLTFMSGDDFGAHFVPEIGDEVLVSFLNGNLENPIIMGSLWNEKKTPPYETTDENNIRAIKSRSGHELVFDDTEDATNLKLKSAQEHQVTLDDENSKITIKDNGGNYICLDASANEITIESSMNVKVKGSGDIEIKSGANITIEAEGVLTLSGSIVKIN